MLSYKYVLGGGAVYLLDDSTEKIEACIKMLKELVRWVRPEEVKKSSLFQMFLHGSLRKRQRTSIKAPLLNRFPYITVRFHSCRHSTRFFSDNSIFVAGRGSPN